MERTRSVYTIKSKEFDLTSAQEIAKSGGEAYAVASAEKAIQIAASVVCTELSLMLMKTENGIMPLHHWDAGKEEERDVSKEHYLCKMRWQEGDDEEIYAQFVDLFNRIAEIAATYDKDDDLNTPNDFVKRSPAAMALWKKYLSPIEVKFLDAKVYMEISEKKKDGAELTRDELRCKEYYDLAWAEESRCRLKNSITAAQTLIFARRLFMLMVLQAPGFIFQSDMMPFAISLALNEYCTQIETIESA